MIEVEAGTLDTQDVDTWIAALQARALEHP
jgi:hypothetical protein